jgi:hypothetical protein
MQVLLKFGTVCNYGDFLEILYSTLLHLPLLRFHWVGGCWDRTQDFRDFCIGSQTL